jgi:DNA polymerase III delta subunit
MIYLLHGDDFAKSRYLVQNQQEKLNTKNRTDLDLKEQPLKDIVMAVSTPRLFGELPFVGADITNAPKFAAEEGQTLVEKTPAESILILLANKSLPKTNIFIQSATKNNLKIITNEMIITSDVFRFVDALFSKNRKAVYTELAKLLKEDKDVFYIFSMVLYGLRNLASYVFDPSSGANLKPFQLSKVKKQAETFSAQKMLNLYAEIYTLEKKAKTGIIDPDMFITMTVEKVLNS